MHSSSVADDLSCYIVVKISLYEKITLVTNFRLHFEYFRAYTSSASLKATGTIEYVLIGFLVVKLMYVYGMFFYCA